MLESFRLGGWGMYPTFFFGVLMLLSSIRYAVKPEQRYLPLQVSLGILTLMAGSLGFVTGLIATFSAMGQVKADDRWFWMLGVGESLHNLSLALVFLVLAGIAATVGAYRFAQLAKSADERRSPA
jgi:hypothetical protein